MTESLSPPPAPVLQGSSQRHGEHPPLSLPGGRLLHHRTLAGRGPPTLSGFLRGSSDAQRGLPACHAGSHPLRVLHRGPDTLCLHGGADPAGGRCICLSAKILDDPLGSFLVFVFVFFCFCWFIARSRRRTAELHPGRSRLSATVQYKGVRTLERGFYKTFLLVVFVFCNLHIFFNVLNCE